MRCPSCGAEVAAGKFCIACGAALTQDCPGCGRVDASGANFCAECGTRLGDAPAAVRPATPPAAYPPGGGTAPADHPFCDLVGSTDLSGRLDPEDLREVTGGYPDAAAEVVKHWDGHVAKFLGDGVLVYFGYPQAHQDDAERSVRGGWSWSTRWPG